MEAILRRRSIRRYQQKKVEKEKINKLLQAGMAAPSAGNEQPWHFIVIEKREKLNKLAKIHPYGHMLEEAPLAILVCGDLSQEKYEGFWVQDCSAATQNILIMAEDIGLGAVWLGVYPEQSRVKEISSYLEIPENVIPLALVSVGYPGNSKAPAERFLEKRIHQDQW